MRDQKRNCEATKIRADGVVLVQFHPSSYQHYPAPITRWATPLDPAEEGIYLFSICNSFTPCMTTHDIRTLHFAVIAVHRYSRRCVSSRTTIL